MAVGYARQGMTNGRRGAVIDVAPTAPAGVETGPAPELVPDDRTVARVVPAQRDRPVPGRARKPRRRRRNRRRGRSRRRSRRRHLDGGPEPGRVLGPGLELVRRARGQILDPVGDLAPRRRGPESAPAPPDAVETRPLPHLVPRDRTITGIVPRQHDRIGARGRRQTRQRPRNRSRRRSSRRRSSRQRSRGRRRRSV